MTDVEIRTIEEKLGVVLPDAYQAAMREYAFSPDSFGAEAMLLDNVESVIELNSTGAEVVGVACPFFIGSDLGEEWYFLDLSQNGSEVYVYDLESGQHRVLDETIGQFLDRVQKAESEIEADERAELERRQNRNWWEFWK